MLCMSAPSIMKGRCKGVHPGDDSVGIGLGMLKQLFCFPNGEGGTWLQEWVVLGVAVEGN